MVRGVGLHTGEAATVRFHLEDGPVRFRVGGAEFRPLASQVTETQRCTALGHPAGQLLTVEHLLAALFIQNIWQGLVIEVEGVEIPILDGSAQPWLEALPKIEAPQPFPIALKQALQVSDGQSRASAQPAPAFVLNTTIAFPHPQIGYQQVQTPPTPFGELALARTFGFMREVQALREKGLIKGASMENALVFGDTQALNPPRRLNEPVLHKALDFLGDLYLTGMPVTAEFSVHRGSHRLHVALAQRLQAQLSINP